MKSLNETETQSFVLYLFVISMDNNYKFYFSLQFGFFGVLLSSKGSVFLDPIYI